MTDGHHLLKDSPGAICSADGTRASGPVMAAGAQGYAYDALRRTAWLARTVWEDTTHAGAAGTGGRRPPRPLPAGLLDAGALLPGAGPGRRRPPGRRAGVGRGASAVVGAAGQGVRRGGRPTPPGAGLLLGLGRPHAGIGPTGLPPALLRPRLGLAARQRADHAGSGALRPARRGTHGRARPGGRGDGDRAPLAGGGGRLRPRHPPGTGAVPARMRPRVPLGGGTAGVADGGGGA